jgi:hypothetical protein
MFVRKLFVVVLLSGLFLDTDIIQSETIVKGAVSGIWTKEKSPYIVTEDIYIETYQSLIINPGVHVYFQDSVTFTIGEEFNTSNRKHQLIAKGSETDSIVFAAQDTSKIWCGFNFVESADDDTIAYAVIRDIHPGKETWNYWNQWGEIEGGVIDIFLSSPQIHNCSIRNNRISDFALLNCYNANPTFSNCIITGNRGLTGEPGEIRPPFRNRSTMLDCYESNVRLENTLIYNNHMCQFFYNTDFTLFTFINMTISKNIFSPDFEPVDFGPLSPLMKTYFVNSIITDNNLDFNSFFGFPFPEDNILLSYSNIDTSSSFSIQWTDSWAYNPFIVWQTDNISSDPLFTDTENNNFILQVNSPCVDAGNPHSAYNDNEDPENPGQALWPAQGTVRNDMGAFGGKSELKSGNSTSVVLNYNVYTKPGEFKLYENYPDPFNPETMIEYNIPKQGKVNITVFNVLGQKIRTLVDSEHAPGMYRTIWDGKDWFGKPANSGIYFYRLDSDNFHEVKRMVLLR